MVDRFWQIILIFLCKFDDYHHTGSYLSLFDL